MNKQSGSAHVVVVTILVLALLGALGFIFWQNFLSKKEDSLKPAAMTSEEEPKKVETKVATSIYSNDAFSFEYPAEGWIAKETRYDSDPSVELTPEITTSDFERNTGMGIHTGAIVSVFKSVAQTSISQEKANLSELTAIENLKDVTVGGVDGFSYRSEYEGTRLCTVVIKSGIMYQIQYQFAGSDESVHKDGYETVVKSFNFK